MWFPPYAPATLLLAGLLLIATPVRAASATATTSATIISPTEVAIVAAVELLKSASVGVLTLSIPTLTAPAQTMERRRE